MSRDYKDLWDKQNVTLACGGGKLVKMGGAAVRAGRKCVFLAALVVSWLPGLPCGQLGGSAEKMQRAAELVQAGNAGEAIPIYRELAKEFPKELAIALNLAIAEYKAAQYRDSIAQCTAVLQERPDMFPAWLFLGASHFELGEASRAVEALEKAITIQPEDRNARVMLADALLDDGRSGESAAEFERAAEAMPDSPRVLDGLGRSYEALASEIFLQLEKSAPGSPEWLALGGDFEVDRGQLTRAFQRFRQALILRSGFLGVHAAIALIYDQTGHPDWAAVERAKEPRAAGNCPSRELPCQFAAGHLREMLISSTVAPESMYWKSKACRGLSQLAYARLRELPPSREKLGAAARADEMKGRYPEAALEWREALRLAPGDLRFQKRLALALCKANDCVSALPIIKDLLEREPASAELNLLYGTALNGAQQHARAAQYLETAVRLNGYVPAARAALGEAYLDAGQPQRAIPQLEAALADDQDGSRHYQLARALQAAGQPERAAAALREYRVIRSRAEEQEPIIVPPE